MSRGPIAERGSTSAPAVSRALSANQELTTSNAELRSANEELLVANEEVQAATEEVETLNEELQATNEELETLNEELQATVEELNTTNDDLHARTIELQESADSLELQRVASELARLRLEASLGATGVPALIVEEDSSVFHATPAWVALMGEGTLVDESGSPLDGPRALEGRTMGGDGFDESVRLVARDGSERSLLARARPIIDAGRHRGAVIVLLPGQD